MRKSTLLKDKKVVVKSLSAHLAFYDGISRCRFAMKAVIKSKGGHKYLLLRWPTQHSCIQEYTSRASSDQTSGCTSSSKWYNRMLLQEKKVDRRCLVSRKIKALCAPKTYVDSVLEYMNT